MLKVVRPQCELSLLIEHGPSEKRISGGVRWNIGSTLKSLKYDFNFIIYILQAVLQIYLILNSLN